MRSEIWKRGEVCKFGRYCWHAHGPLQLQSMAYKVFQLFKTTTTEYVNTEEAS
ncbi:hypothetical protein KIN20_013183 [Parelaphostrongylus tenuis]|uniref:C3H1-type domain-containing protein n=1 Tax=Parelaphostrongylus tenuis TaxID=148309 RepID=A0AAD5QNB8_PARTN|nr:hypothetical protein KIN20_013183 [Parelaphostrongylus tenuis]